MLRWLAALLYPSFLLLAAPYSKLSEVEKTSVERALKEHKLLVDMAPSGKTIDQIYTYKEAPFAPQDGWLTFFNFVHVTTQDEVVFQYLQLSPGDPYSEALVAQSEQSLLAGYRSFAVIIPVQKIQNARSDTVDLLVVSRDTWSLRANFEPSLTGFQLDTLQISLLEGNIFGYDKQAQIAVQLNKTLLDMGFLYTDPAVLLSNHRLSIGGGLFFRRDFGALAGGRAQLSFGIPLSKQDREWGYQSAFQYEQKPIIKYVGNQIASLPIDGTNERVPIEYHWEQWHASLLGLRSFGREVKHNLQVGYGFNWYRPTLPTPFLYSETAKEAFVKRILPVSELESFLVFGYNHFWNQFRVLYNVTTLDLAETYREGPELGLALHFGNHVVLRGDLDFIRPMATVGYTLFMGTDSFLRLDASLQTRFQGKLVDTFATAEAMGVLPAIEPLGRLVLHAKTAKRIFDRSRLVYVLGGSDGGIRSLPYQFYQGTQFWNTNAEWRTRGVSLGSVRLGGVLFYDSGVAFSSNNPAWTHGIGAGLRVLVVPFNRSVYRLDYSIPVAGPLQGLQHGLVTFGVDQAF